MIGTVATWDTSSNMHKSQIKVSKRQPDYLIILSKLDDTAYSVVPCWINDPGYTTRISASPQDLYVDAKSIIAVKEENLLKSNAFCLKDIPDALHRIEEKNLQIKEKKHVAKVQRTQRKREAELRSKEKQKRARERKVYFENTYGLEYEIAEINHDIERMKRIEQIVGHDPRRHPGTKGSSNLSRVTNFKPCVGGKVSPK